MSFGNLSETETRRVAQDIRKLLEPEGASSSKVSTESDIRKLLSLKYNIQIEGMCDIVELLSSNYGEKSIRRLKRKIKSCVVWDTSICNLPTQDLLNLFYGSNDYVNLITSLTLQELLNLAYPKLHEENYNAKLLVQCILEDVDSKYSITVDLKKTESYVDTQLLQFCSHNGYAMYTYDMALGLRARSHNIQVFNFNKAYTHYSYHPNENGKDIILDKNVLKRPLKAVIETAKRIGGRRFILTRELIELLEKLKDTENIKQYIIFFLVDVDGNYTKYISDSDTTDIVTLAEKYDAVIFTAVIKDAFALKSFYHKFRYVPFPGETLLDMAGKKYSLPSDILKTDLDVKLLTSESELSYKPDDSSSSNTEKSVVSSGDTLEDVSKTSSDDDTITVSSKDTPKISDDDTTNTGVNNDALPEVNRFVNVLSKNDDSIICQIPHYSKNKKRISQKIDLTSKLWILDDTKHNVSLKSDYTLKPNYTVIHCANGLDNTFYLNVYTVISSKHDIFGKLIFSKEFTKHHLDEIPTEYKKYAEVGSLLT